jgi:hypothetical protein
MSLPTESLPQIRFDITESARILRISRATLYERIRLGEIRTQKAGGFQNVSRSKRLCGVANAAPNLSGHQLVAHQLNRFI